MSRLSGKDVINKRQLEKLIQAGCFDELESNRAKLFENVTNFVEIYSNSKLKLDNQSLLFEEQKNSFNDSNLFLQNIPEWNSGHLLKNELEVMQCHEDPSCIGYLTVVSIGILYLVYRFFTRGMSRQGRREALWDFLFRKPKNKN